jgi:hypothetical protein
VYLFLLLKEVYFHNVHISCLKNPNYKIFHLVSSSVEIQSPSSSVLAGKLPAVSCKCHNKIISHIRVKFVYISGTKVNEAGFLVAAKTIKLETKCVVFEGQRSL